MQKAKEKILNSSLRLYYEEGYRVTGISRLVADAKVTKATFYAHFSSKDDLCVAYIREQDRKYWEETGIHMDRFDTTEQRFLGPLQLLRERILQPNYRGCPFQNLIGELADIEHPATEIAIRHLALHRQWLRGLTLKLKSSSTKYRHLDEDLITDIYFYTLEGLKSVSATQGPDTQVGMALRHIKTLAGI